MTTTTVLARGSALSRQNIVDGWTNYTNTPECVDHPHYEQLINTLVDATVEAGNAALPDGASWHPHVSEIVGPVGTDLGDDFDIDEFTRNAGDTINYDKIEADVFYLQVTDLKVEIEVSSDGQIWQAIDSPEPLSDDEGAYDGTVNNIADQIARDYRDGQEHEGAAPGLQVRVNLLYIDDETGTQETIATSDVHTVDTPAWA